MGCNNDMVRCLWAVKCWLYHLLFCLQWIGLDSTGPFYGLFYGPFFCWTCVLVSITHIYISTTSPKCDGAFILNNVMRMIYIKCRLCWWQDISSRDKGSLSSRRVMKSHYTYVPRYLSKFPKVNHELAVWLPDVNFTSFITVIFCFNTANPY